MKQKNNNDTYNDNDRNNNDTYNDNDRSYIDNSYSSLVCVSDELSCLSNQLML